MKKNADKQSESENTFFGRVFVKVKEKAAALIARPVLFMFVSSFIINVIIEMLSQHSVVQGFLFIFRNPVAFLLGTGIIVITLLPALFIKKRYPYMVLLLFLWLALGIADRIITAYRLDPFSINDFALLGAALPILRNYMGIAGMIASGLAIVGAVVLVVLMFIKMPSEKFMLSKRIKGAVGAVAVFALVLFTAAQSGAVGEKIPMAQAYKVYGFTYCFTAGMFSRGVSKPDGYSKEAVDDIQSQLDDVTADKASEENPNVILIQLEAFFDAKYIEGTEYEKDPTPTFTELKKTCRHGLLTVPVIGGGTANTEFEVLTGMNKEHFGMGEYPYKTVLQDNTCESICYNLKASGYSTHAIHNHYGTFYDRYKVFRNLGFDTFTPVEHMTYVPTTITGWEKDEILPTYISACLNSTETRDFVFAVTVQGHGTYPTSYDTGFSPSIQVRADGFTDAQRIALEYYVESINETDAMIAKLIEAYSDFDEPVMIVLYGDHLPNFEITDDDLSYGSVVQTEYVIWTNYEQGQAQDKDIAAYQLSAYVMQLCGKTDGILTKVHQTYSDSDDYEYMLQMLEYSMLYDNSAEMEHVREKYAPTDIRYGILGIEVTGAGQQYDEEAGQSMSVVKGKNFTAWSVVYINGLPARTVFKDPSTLILEKTDLKNGDIITVAQVAQDKTVLSVTSEYIVETEG